MVKDDSTDYITFLRCLVVHCLCSLHCWTRKCALPGVMSGLCIAIRRWYSALWRSRQTLFDETGCSHPRLKFSQLIWSCSPALPCTLKLCTDIMILAYVLPPTVVLCWWCLSLGVPSQHHLRHHCWWKVSKLSCLCHSSSCQTRPKNHPLFQSHWDLLLQPYL